MNVVAARYLTTAQSQNETAQCDDKPIPSNVLLSFLLDRHGRAQPPVTRLSSGGGKDRHNTNLEVGKAKRLAIAVVCDRMSGWCAPETRRNCQSIS